MKILDWIIFNLYCALPNNGDRDLRAAFGLWFVSSWIYVIMFIVLISVTEIHLTKPLWLTTFFSLFCLNYWFAYKQYIANKRFKKIIRDNLGLGENVKRIRAIIGITLFIITPFLTIVVAVIFQQNN